VATRGSSDEALRSEQVVRVLQIGQLDVVYRAWKNDVALAHRVARVEPRVIVGESLRHDTTPLADSSLACS
jgi:hypothetical protein